MGVVFIPCPAVPQSGSRTATIPIPYNDRFAVIIPQLVKKVCRKAGFFGIMGRKAGQEKWRTGKKTQGEM
jgi:hypothetical protein